MGSIVCQTLNPPRYISAVDEQQRQLSVAHQQQQARGNTHVHKLQALSSGNKLYFAMNPS